MLNVTTPEEARALLKERFKNTLNETEIVPLGAAAGRVLAEDIFSPEAVPTFDRSTVDGFAVRAKDTFGASEALPSLLKYAGEVDMGRAAGLTLAYGECAYVPTGGALPAGADAVVMLEYVSELGAERGVERPASPGSNIIFAGDDIGRGQLLFKKGRILFPRDEGALAALGLCTVSAVRKPRVAVISTGDELVPPNEAVTDGKVRDVNAPLLSALLAESGAESVRFPIVRDDADELRSALRAASEFDVTLISGGSSAGARDMTAALIGELGECFMHGLAMKPGKPTVIGEISGKPVFGLPGHPVAACFVYRLIVRPTLDSMTGAVRRELVSRARVSVNIPSNHGRAECVPVRLQGGVAEPIRIKSGLITLLRDADGFIYIPRDSEGLRAGAETEVYAI